MPVVETSTHAVAEWPDLDRVVEFERREVHIRRLTGFGRADGTSVPLAEQCRQALANGAQSLAAAGLSMDDVIRVVYLLRDADGFPSCFPLLRDAFGDARPGATLHLVDGFETPEVEIELELIACTRPAA